MADISIGKVALILVCLFPIAVALKTGIGRSNPAPPVDVSKAEPEKDEGREDALKFQIGQVEYNTLPVLRIEPICPPIHSRSAGQMGQAYRDAFLSAAAADPDLGPRAVEAYRADCACEPAYRKDIGRRGDRLSDDMETAYLQRYISNENAKSPYFEPALWNEVYNSFADRFDRTVNRKRLNRDKYRRTLRNELRRRSETREDIARCIMTLAGEDMLPAAPSETN
jgi:hypothetical protein